MGIVLSVDDRMLWQVLAVWQAIATFLFAVPKTKV
jgi:hypothetical protein